MINGISRCSIHSCMFNLEFAFIELNGLLIPAEIIVGIAALLGVAV